MLVKQTLPLLETIQEVLHASEDLSEPAMAISLAPTLASFSLKDVLVRETGRRATKGLVVKDEAVDLNPLKKSPPQHHIRRVPPCIVAEDEPVTFSLVSLVTNGEKPLGALGRRSDVFDDVAELTDGPLRPLQLKVVPQPPSIDKIIRLRLKGLFVNTIKKGAAHEVKDMTVAPQSSVEHVIVRVGGREEGEKMLEASVVIGGIIRDYGPYRISKIPLVDYPT
ncbi:hypothetical protein CSOJ01_14373 [Colletotrichum sojae]|uniref:Uncharacterized protein n=1 Tax=Colletotrichum sojae TaxID=2175907 RepID=A0A8H6IQN9_9PEZI|nr:hypothetical protein CSOJ01_14373 [Colletotrichum sojae]